MAVFPPPTFSDRTWVKTLNVHKANCSYFPLSHACHSRANMRKEAHINLEKLTWSRKKTRRLSTRSPLSFSSLHSFSFRTSWKPRASSCQKRKLLICWTNLSGHCPNSRKRSVTKYRPSKVGTFNRRKISFDSNHEHVTQLRRLHSPGRS